MSICVRFEPLARMRSGVLAVRTELLVAAADLVQDRRYLRVTLKRHGFPDKDTPPRLRGGREG